MCGYVLGEREAKEMKEEIELTIEERRVIEALKIRRGKAKAIKMKDLYREMTGENVIYETITSTRKLRHIINHLKWRHGIPIMSCSTGYYMVREPEELAECCAFFRKRAMTELYNESVLKKISLAELMGQMVLDTEIFKHPILADKPEVKEQEIPARYTVITKLLDELQKDPKKYEDELEELREKYGALFVSRKRLKDIHETARRLVELTSV